MSRLINEKILLNDNINQKMKSLTNQMKNLKIDNGKKITIHTSKKDEVEKMLNEINIDFNIQKKKYKENIYETFNWFNLPSFEWYKSENIVFEIKLKKEKREIFYKTFNQKEGKKSWIHYHKKKNPYKEYEYYFSYYIQPKYPVYVISKGRYEKRYTTDTLEKMGVDYKIVIEPQEFKQYNKYIDEKNILILPDEYLNKNQGSIPSRNFIWEHSSKNGYKKHWILDDNMDGFFRWNYNVKKRINSGVFFRIMEDYTDRHTNIGLSSPNYSYVPPSIDTNRNMIIVNSRCYSFILVNNELLDNILEERWRGTYNEDTDLSLRVLDKGYSTFLFNNLLCGKKTSGTMKGGNTDTIYDGGSHSGYKKKFDELYNNFPNYVKLTYKKHKDGRPHHHINYTKLFKHNKPILKKRYIQMFITERERSTNEYNMIFIKKK